MARVATPPSSRQTPGSAEDRSTELGGLGESRAYRVLAETSGMLLLFAQALRASVSPPFSWRADCVQESWLIVKRCTIPVMFSTTMFGFGAPGLQGANVINVFGTIDRMGAFFVMASVREFAPWINGMVIAGVAGTAICADLGARKIRDELAAMSVMGIDPVRTLVVPRFWALGIMTPLMNLIAVLCGVVGGWGATMVWGGTSAGYIMTFESNFNLPDLLGTCVKTLGMGFIIAIAACYQGIRAEGGPMGVGRAVNRGVVIGVVGLWVFNAVFTSVLLAAYPETSNLR